MYVGVACGCWTYGRSWHPIHALSPYIFHQFIPIFSYIFQKKLMCFIFYKQVSLILASSPPLFFAMHTQRDTLMDVQKREK